MSNPYDEMMKKVEKIEKSGQSLKDFVIKSTCGEFKHKMIVEENYRSISELNSIYEDMVPFEIADLTDYQSLIGRYDGNL